METERITLEQAKENLAALEREKSRIPGLKDEAKYAMNAKRITELRRREAELADEIEDAVLALDVASEVEYKRMSEEYNDKAISLLPAIEEAERNAQAWQKRVNALQMDIQMFQANAREYRQYYAQVSNNRRARLQAKRSREVNHALLSTMNPMYLRD